MWIEIFKPDNIPTPIDITPQPPKQFELRIIIWNTADVVLNERNILGTKMSDIYVKWYLSYLIII